MTANANGFETATAHHAWDRRWSTTEGRAEWLEPEEDLRLLLPELRARGCRDALDLGCGVGRHALFLAEAGFAVEAIDGSPKGLTFAQAAAAERGLAVPFRAGLMTDLPVPSCAFDFVVAWNVIYHGASDVVERTIGEIFRVLRPGGLYLGTMLTKRNVNFGRGREVGRGTFVIDGDNDKGHPHFYCDAGELAALFAEFEVLSLKQVEHRRPGSWHWHLLAEKVSVA
ncbi:class I SAM-dependent methyltransferase [Rhodospirillaceae bacterium SYSU D60014]|uniref:class I SAM-dependent methyltransferase n=1 Tax=Virgifigura deserti TaxID=2268457 RepID=UPI000E66CCA1